MTSLGGRTVALSLDPISLIGGAVTQAADGAWTAAMTALWSGALWVLKLSFTVIDSLTTPDVSAAGPVGAVLPTTLFLGAGLAVLMMLAQVTVALVRRDGQSLGRVVIGLGQFGLVWAGYLGVAGVLVAAAAGLEKGILAQMLHVSSLSQIPLSTQFPTSVGDAGLATVLGMLSIVVVIPASFFFLVIMFVREAALIILVATAGISAAGLMSETGKVWFWKSLRWFISCLLISPMSALVLGIGVKVSAGLISPAKPTPAQVAACQAMPSFARSGCVTSLTDQASAASHAGMAVVGCVIIAVAACCPLVLFRLLAFVEPGTASGAALRQSWGDAGGLSGLLGGSGGRQAAGGAAATASGGDGRAQGETGAEAQTQSRLMAGLGAFGHGVRTATSLAHRAADLGSDVLGQAGVGSPGYSMTPVDARSSNPRGSTPPRPNDTVEPEESASPDGPSDDRTNAGPGLDGLVPPGTPTPTPGPGGAHPATPAGGATGGAGAAAAGAGGEAAAGAGAGAVIV